MISREMQLAVDRKIREFREQNPQLPCARAYRALYPDQVSLEDFRQVWQHVVGENPAIEPAEPAEPAATGDE